MSSTEDAIPREGVRSRIREFFHAPEIPYGPALVRIALTIPVFIVTAYRWRFAREIFSTDGSPVPLCECFGSHFVPVPSGPVAVAIASVCLMTLLTACVGWCTRVSLILATTSYVYLNMQDTMASLNKSTAIAAHLLFILCFSECGSLWSIDSWLARCRAKGRGLIDEANRPRAFPVWPRRLMQLVIGGAYLGTAVTKLQTPLYFTGEELQTWMITTYHSPRLLGSALALHPAIVIFFSVVAFAWEAMFIFLSWKSKGRLVMLSIGVVFHIMTCFILGLFIFPMIILASYFAFVDEGDIAWLRRVLGSRGIDGSGIRSAFASLARPLAAWSSRGIAPEWSYAAFGALAMVTATGGIGLEWKLDPYGIRRPEGPYQLKKLEPDEVATMLGPCERMRNEDKVLTFDVGSMVVAGTLLDRRSEFHVGEVVRAQCGLLFPHEDMWLECNLHDAEDRDVSDIGVFVTKGASRPLFYYIIGDCLPAGRYSLVLKIAGEEIIRRPITILPRIKACAAN
jgi:hypothetical protein